MALGVIRVRRSYRTLPMTPEACHANGWRVEVKCVKCGTPRPLALDPAGRLRRLWGEDWEAIFKRRVFKCCKCMEPASGLRVTRQGRDHPEVLLLVQQEAYHG